MSDRPKRDPLLAALSLPVAGGLAVVGLALVLAAPSFAVNVVGASLLGLAGLVVMIDIFIRIGLSEDHERAAEERAREGEPPAADPPSHPPSASAATRPEREPWKPRRRP